MTIADRARTVGRLIHDAAFADVGSTINAGIAEVIRLALFGLFWPDRRCTRQFYRMFCMRRSHSEGRLCNRRRYPRRQRMRSGGRIGRDGA
jgi:hypothetical protein